MKKSLVVLVFSVMFLVGGFSFVCGEGLLWSLESENSNWALGGGDLVSLGDDGGLVFFLPRPMKTNYQLISSYDLGTPSDIFGRLPQGEGSLYDSDTLVAPISTLNSYDEDSFYTNFLKNQYMINKKEFIIHKVDSTSSDIIWEHIIPVTHINSYDSGMFVDDGGTRIVTITMDNGNQGKNLIEVLNEETGEVVNSYYLSMEHNYRYQKDAGHDLSGDGSTLIFIYRGGLSIPVMFDVDSGEILYFHVDDFGLSASLNYDGSKAIFDSNLGEVTLLERQVDGNYLSEVIYTGSDIRSQVCNDNNLDIGVFFRFLKLTNDGSEFFYASGLGCKNGDYHYCFGVYNIDTEVNDLKYCFQSESSGSTGSNSISDLTVSKDEETFAVGTWGNIENTVPEVYVFRKDVSGIYTTFDTDGSVLDLDLSDDGIKLAVSDRGCFWYDDSCVPRESVKLFEIGEPPLTLHGVPRANSVVRFEQPYLGGNQINRVLYSKTFRPSMTPFGWLYPDRHSLFILPRGIDTGALTRTVFTIPDEVGEEYWFQGWSLEPRGLSENYLKVRVLT